MFDADVRGFGIRRFHCIHVCFAKALHHCCDRFCERVDKLDALDVTKDYPDNRVARYCTGTFSPTIRQGISTLVLRGFISGTPGSGRVLKLHCDQIA
jgi:hypothetical protein